MTKTLRKWLGFTIAGAVIGYFIIKYVVKPAEDKVQDMVE